MGFHRLLKNTSPEADFVPLRGREAIYPLSFAGAMLDRAIIDAIDSLCLMVLNRQINVDVAEMKSVVELREVMFVLQVPVFPTFLLQ